MTTTQSDPVSTADLLGLDSPPAQEPVLPVEVDPGDRPYLYAEHDQLAAKCGAMTSEQCRKEIAAQIGTQDYLPEAAERAFSMVMEHRLETMAESGRPNPSDEAIADPLAIYPEDVVKQARQWAAVGHQEGNVLHVASLCYRIVSQQQQAADHKRKANLAHGGPGIPQVEPVRATIQKFNDGWGVHIPHESMPPEMEEPKPGLWCYVIPRNGGDEELKQVSSVEVETPYGWLCRTGGENP